MSNLIETPSYTPSYLDSHRKKPSTGGALFEDAQLYSFAGRGRHYDFQIDRMTTGRYGETVADRTAGLLHGLSAFDSTETRTRWAPKSPELTVGDELLSEQAAVLSAVATQVLAVDTILDAEIDEAMHEYYDFGSAELL